MNYSEAAEKSPPPSDASSPPPSVPALSPTRRSSSSSSQRSKRQKTERASPAGEEEDDGQQLVEEKAHPSPPPADGLQSDPAEAEERKEADATPISSDDKSPSMDEDKEEEESGDEEWKEGGHEGRKRGRPKKPRDDAIVVDDDEAVDQLFSLPSSTQPPLSHSLTHSHRRGALGGSLKKKKKPPTRPFNSSLLDSSTAPSPPTSDPSPPPTSKPTASSRKSERAVVTVSKADAILLEDSLEGFPSSAKPSSAFPHAPSSSSLPSARPTFSFLPPPHKRKAPSSSFSSSFPPPSTSAVSSSSSPSLSFPSQSASLAAMRQVLGPGYTDSLLQHFLIAANYNCERAISNILDSPSAVAQLKSEGGSQHSPSSSSSPPPPPPQRSHTEPPLKDSSRTPPSSPDSPHGDAKAQDEEEATEDFFEEFARKARERAKSERAESSIQWSRKLLLVLRVDAGCTTDGERVVSEGESITFRDQTRDTYLLRQLRQQKLQGSRKGAKALRREIRAERKKEHRILRFVPSSHLNALEIGTLPRNVSDVLVPLFDRRLIDLTAVVASPCPVRFDLLSTIPLLLSVWVLPAVFEVKREVHVERKGFMGRVAADAADADLNPLDTFLALLTALHIQPIASSMKEEGHQHSLPPLNLPTPLLLPNPLVWLTVVVVLCCCCVVWACREQVGLRSSY